MTLPAILFDLDETLMIEVQSVRDAMLAACTVAADRGVDAEALRQAVLKRAKEFWYAAPTADYCRTVGISSWEGLHGDFSGDDPNLAAIRERVPEFRMKTWTAALADYGVLDAELAGTLDLTWRRERTRRHLKFPDTDSTLAALKPKFRFGLVTNGAPRIQRDKIERAGIATQFDAVVVSGDVGVGKPDPRVFARALEMLRVKPHETVMIGNSLDRDIDGARAAGIPRIWIDREGVEACPSDTNRITSLAELCTLLLK